MSISWIFIFYPNKSNYKQAQASSYNIHALSEPNSIIKGTMFSFKNRETSFHLVVAYLISSKAFLAFLSSSFIIRSSLTREYFFGSFRIRKMMSSTEILPGRPTSIAFFVCKTRRYMYLNLKEAGCSTNLKPSGLPWILNIIFFSHKVSFCQEKFKNLSFYVLIYIYL